MKWYSSITKITTTSTADQSLQNWIWRETLCVWACCWCRQERNLWQQRLVAPGWHLFPAAPTTAPKMLLHWAERWQTKVLLKYSLSFLIINAWEEVGTLISKPPLLHGGHPKVYCQRNHQVQNKGAQHHNRGCLPKIPHRPVKKGPSYINTVVNTEGTTNQRGLVYLNATKFNNVSAYKVTKHNIYVWTRSCHRK